MKNNFDKVILVDEHDRELGTQDKLQAHVEGNLHRAFSIFIFNSKGQVLMQQRAAGKYHSAGLWTNTCCSHPQPGISMEQALQQRLMEEMGMSCTLEFQFSFRYKASFDNGLTEHELDHVYFGMSDTLPIPNPEEVDQYKYMDMGQLKDDIALHPEKYTAWMRIIMEKLPQNVSL